MARLLVLVGTLGICILCSPAHAVADPTVPHLVERLSESKDFRVRTQAALALGVKKDKKAVSPLCTALRDKSTSVRTAAAAALGRLLLGGTECLRQRRGAEQNKTVLAAIDKALTRLQSGGSGELSVASDAQKITAATSYYVAIGKTSDKTGRKNGVLDKMVRESMRKAAQRNDKFAIAPDGETTGQAKKTLSNHKRIKSYYLLPTVAAPKYADGNLRIQIEVVMFTYPGRAMLGTYSVSLTQQSVPSKDAGAEDNLIQMAAERAMEKFSDQYVGQLQ